MSQFIVKGETLANKIKLKSGLSDFKKELRDEIQSFYEDYIIPYQTEPNNYQKHMITQQNYEMVMKNLYHEYIMILKFTQMAFVDNDIQQMRYFILDKIMEDSKKSIQPINAELIDSLNNIIQDDNNKNSLLGIKALFYMMNCQYSKLININNQKYDVSPFEMVAKEVLENIYVIVNQFIYHKMQNFQNLKNVFHQQKDKSQYSHYLKDQNIQKQSGQQQQNEVPLIENKYDLRTYEEMTATVSTIIIFLGQAQKQEPVNKQGEILQKIRQIIDTIKKYLKLGVDAIANTNFEYTQQEFNRKFHEDLGSIHRKMISYFQIIYKDFQQLDSTSQPSQLISDLQRATQNYIVKFPDEYIDIKIQLYKEFQKILSTQIVFNDQDLNKVSMSYTEVFQMDRIVSNYNKIEILNNYLKIVKNVLLQEQQPNIKKPHFNTKIGMIPEPKIYQLVERAIDSIIAIIYDNTVNIQIMINGIDILNQLFSKYYIYDQEYFKRNQANLDLYLNKIRMTEEILKFIGDKYKDLNIVLISVQTYLKKQFMKSLQPQKLALHAPGSQVMLPTNPQAGNPVIQAQQVRQLPIQQGTPQQNIQTNLNNSAQLAQMKAKTIKIEQKLPLGQPRMVPNPLIASAAAAQNVQKLSAQAVPANQEDEAAFQKKYTEWIQKKRNHVSLSQFPKMQRAKRQEAQELQKIQQEILDNEDYSNYYQLEQSMRQFIKEEIQAEFEGDFLSYHAIEIKRENLQFYLSEMSNLYKSIIGLQSKYQNYLLNFNIELKKLLQQNDIQNKNQEKYNLNASQIIILRKIFKNGLELFTNFHQMYHVEIRFHDSSFIRRFIQNFALIEHECHFKDIIEPNFKNILKFLIKTQQDSDKCQCFKSITELAFIKYDQNNPAIPPTYMTTANFFNHILLKNLFLIVEQSNETLDPFNEFYSLYKNKFFEIIQNLIDRVFSGIIAQYDNDSYKQIIKKSILFLFKKIHTSPYPLEYMKILKWFAHQLYDQSLKNQNKENQIRLEILSICQSQDRLADMHSIDQINSEINQNEDLLGQKDLPEEKRNQIKEKLRKLKESSKNFEGINILDNYMQLLELNCSKFQVQIAKIYLCLAHFQNQNIDLQRKKQIAKILLICMSLSERNMATRALNQLEQMTQKLQREEVEIVLEDIKEELLDRLYQLASENRPLDIYSKEKEIQKIQQQQQQQQQNKQNPLNQQSSSYYLQDNSKIAFKLLSKLSFLTKQHKIHTFLFENEQPPEHQEKIYVEFDIFYNKNGQEDKKNIKLDVKQSVEHSINLFNRIINNYNNQPMKSNVIEISFAMIKFSVIKFFCRCDQLDISWLYENENGVFLQEQQKQNQEQQIQQPGSEIMQEEFEVKKKILREFSFKSQDISDAEKELDKKYSSLFGVGSSTNGNPQNLLIMRLLKILMDLVSIDQKSERDQGLLLKIRKESERILSVISRVISQNLIDLLINQHNQNPAQVSNYFKNIFLNKCSPHYVFISTLIKSLKNQNFMERKTNQKAQPCNEKQFLWNELFVKNMHKYLTTDGTKYMIQQLQQPNQQPLDPSPRTMNIENDSGKQSIEAMIGELENFVVSQITKEIANNNDSFIQTTCSKQLFFPSTASQNNNDFPKQVMGSSIISSHNFESQSESRMFDNNNNSLNKRFCLVECLNEVMNFFKPKIIGQHISNILDSAFIISNNLPEIVNLQSMQDFCQLLIKKILQYIKKQKDQYNLNSLQMRKILQTFVTNLTTCKPISHLYSRNALNSISKIHGTNILSILYLSITGNQNEDIKFHDQFDQLIAQAKKDDDLADNLATAQQLEQMPCKYDVNLLIKNHNTLFITQLLSSIFSSIQMFYDDYNYNSQPYYTQNSFINRRILCVFNCFKSLEYLFMSENCLPFRLVTLNKASPENREADSNQSPFLPILNLDLKIVHYQKLSLNIIQKNNIELKTSRIIIPFSNPQNPNEQPQQANVPHPPNYGPPPHPQGGNAPPHQHLPPPQVPNGVQHNPQMNQMGQIPGRQMSMNESGFAGGPQPPNPRNQNGPMINPHPNQPPNHPNMNPNNPNRMMNQYPPNNPQGPNQMNPQANVVPPPPAPGRQNPYPHNNMPPPPNAPNYPPNYYGNQPQQMNQQGRPVAPNMQQRPPNAPLQQQLSQSKNQNSFINQCQLFYEDELGLNIEDLNFNLKNWAKLISSIALFLKSINLSAPAKYLHSLIDKEERRLFELNNPNFVKFSNEIRNKVIENIEELKYQNLIRLYDLMPRIEKTIHSNVQESINEINKKNGNINKMALEEEKLKIILRPVLFCLQSSFKKFTPQFLLIFKKILKMLVNCFNVKLIALLIQNLDTIIKETSMPANEQSFSDYKIKNISGLLSLFQHLKNSLYQNTKGTKETASSREQIKLIINKTIKIQENYSVRYGWYYVEQKTLKPIAKLLNVQTDFITEILMKDKRTNQNNQLQNAQAPNQQQNEGLSEQALEFIYKILKMEQSFELREYLTREIQDQDFFVRFWDPTRPPLLQLKIIYLLAKKSSRVFTKSKIDGIKFLIDESKKIQQPPNLTNIKCYILFMKLFVLYFQRKRDINILYCIIGSYNERLPTPQFLKRFFEEEVPSLLSLDQKKKLLQSSLNSMCMNMDVSAIRIYLKLIIKPIVKSFTKEQIIQINFQPLQQSRGAMQSMIDFFIDIQKKFEERFKRFQQDIQNIPRLQMQLQQAQQQQQQQQVFQINKDIYKITRNNDRFSKELVLLDMCRITFLFGKELKPDFLKKFLNYIYQIATTNLEQTENPIIKQLYYQLLIKIMKLQNMQTDTQRKRLLLNNIFKGYNFNEQEQAKNYFVQQLIINNINCFIKNIVITKQNRQDSQRQISQLPPQQQAVQNPQQIQQQNQLNIQNQQGSQSNQMVLNQGIAPGIVAVQQTSDNKASYEIIREFLEMDKDKIILNSIITYNENFYEIRDLVAVDFFKELKDAYTSYKTKFKKESGSIKEFFKSLEDENGGLLTLLESKNSNDYVKSQFYYNLINTYVSWKFREQKEEQAKNGQNSSSQKMEIDKSEEKKFGKHAIYFLTLFILESATFEERVLELFQILIKKCIILWSDVKIQYKMIKYKYIFNILKLDNEIMPQTMQPVQFMQSQKLQMNRFYILVLNVLNICLECSFDVNYNYQIKHIFKTLNWSTLYQINKSKQKNKNPSISSAQPSIPNGQQGVSTASAVSIPGSNPQQPAMTPDGVQGEKSVNKLNQPGQQRKAIIKERKDYQSIMNITENEPFMIIMTANILYSILDICEDEPFTKQSKEFKGQLFSQLKSNIEVHHFYTDNQEKQIQDNEPPMSIDLMVKLIMYFLKLDMKDMRDDLSSIRVNQILMILESQNKQHKQKEDDRIYAQDKLYYENFFCPKYAHYIPQNSSLYFETSKINSQKLLNQFYEEKVDVDQTQGDDFYTEYSQQIQNKKNKYLQLLKRDAGFETYQCDIDKSLKYSPTLFKEHQEFFEFPIIRNQPNKYSYAQNLNGLMYISLCLIALTKENKQETLVLYAKRIIKVLFNVIDEGSLYSLRVEALTLLKTFFLGRENFPNKEIPQRYNLIDKIVNILPSTTKEEIVKWIFVFPDIEKKYRKFSRQFYYSIQEDIGCVNITRIAEENIQFQFFKFLVDILKMTESTLKNVPPVELRKYLILFSKVSSSNNLDYFFNTIEQNENLNELNTMFLLLGQAKYEEKLSDRNYNRDISDELQTHLQRDEGEIPYYENDDIYLMAFKFLLFKIKKISQKNVKLVLNNFADFPKMTITTCENQQRKTPRNLLYEDVQELLEEVHEFDSKRQLEWILECVQDMMQSCTRKTTIANDFKSMEIIDEFRYIVLAQQNVSKFTPLNIQLIQPTFHTLIKFMIDSCLKREQRVHIYESIEEYLIFFNSQTYNTYGNKAYSIPACSPNEDRRISKNWAYALFQVFFFEFDKQIPYILNPNRVYQIIRTHHCWDIGLIYLEKVIELMNEGKFDADIQVFEKIQQIYQDLGETDYMYGTMNQLIKNDNLRKALCLAQQREFQQAQQALIENIDKLNENDQSFCNLYSSYTQDYETLYFISTYRQLFIETQKNLNEWDTLINLSKNEQNDHLLSESSYYSLNKNIKEVVRVLDKDLQIVKEIKEKERYENQNFYFQPSFMYLHTNILQMFQQRVKALPIIESIQKAGIQLAYEWASLPKTITKAHYNIITQLQTLTELEEANILLTKFRSEDQKYYQSAFPTFQQMIQQQRERLPHKYESLTNWKILMNQREYIYNFFYEFIKEKLNIQDRINQPTLPNGSSLQKEGKEIILQYIDSDWNNYQYFKTLQNYGITNLNLLPPKRNEFFSIEDQSLRLKCLMKNWLIDSSSVCESNISEIQKLFSDSILKYRRLEHFRPYFDQMQQQISLKESQMLFKKNKYFDTIQNVKVLLSKPFYINKICYSYLEICYCILRSEKTHTDFFNKMILTFMTEALKYKPYYSRLYFVLFFSQEFLTPNLEFIQQLDIRSYQNSLILWLPKILYTYQKYKTQDNQAFTKAFEKMIQPLKYFEQHLFLTIRSYLPFRQDRPTPLLETYQSLRNIQSTCKKIECVFKILQTILTTDVPSKYFMTFDLQYQELNNIIEQIQNVPNLQAYYDLLNQQILPSLSNVIQTFKTAIPDLLKIQNIQLYINANSTPSQVIEFIRKNIYGPLISFYNENKQNFACEYSIKSLLAFSQDASEIEIPGQYVCNNPRIFREFTPKNHIFMSSLQKEVEVQLSYRKLIKRIAINASNCKQYTYEIDYEWNQAFQHGNLYPFCNSEVYSHRQLEIGMLQQCLNSQFFQQRETYSRDLKISQRVRIPIECMKQTTTIVLKSSSRTNYSMQTINDWYLTQHCSQHDNDHIDTFNMHLNDLDLEKPNITNERMKEIVNANALVQFILSKSNTYQEYIDVRKEFSYSYAAASFSHYILGQSASLQDISFDYNTGEVFIETKNLEIRNNQVVFKNPHSIRVSPSIAKFIGQIGISGIVCSSFVSMAKAVTCKEIPMLQVIQSVVEDLLQLNNIPDDKQIHEKILQKILWIYSQDYFTNNYSKNEMGTRVFTIFDLIQENQNNLFNPVSHKYWF